MTTPLREAQGSLQLSAPSVPRELKQTSLLSFMGATGPGASLGGTTSSVRASGSGGQGPLRRYFYLSFAQGIRPKEEAYFTERPPPGARLDIQQTFNACGQEFVLCGTLFQGEGERGGREDTFPYNPPREKKYRNVGFLKSHLQKCVRKMNPILGVPTAFHYMSLDIKDFLRRICIIMLEDASLHPSFTTLVWFMIASGLKSGFHWHARYYNYLLGVVYLITTTREFDALASGGGGAKVTTTLGALKRLTSYHVLERREDASLLYAMQIRADYGGMKCDVDMLQKYATFWMERFREEGRRRSWPPVRPITFEATTPLKLEDWDKSAIDFHCAPQILDYLMAKFPGLATPEIFQTVIWNYASRINARIPAHAALEGLPHRQVWETIQSTLPRLQAYLLEEGY